MELTTPYQSEFYFKHINFRRVGIIAQDNRGS